MTKIIKKKIIIEDLICTSCAMLIDGDLEDLDGVKSSNTSYAKCECEVEFEDGLISIGEIITQIKKTGYTGVEKVDSSS